MADKPIHSMTPQELADAGIPVEVALRARVEHASEMVEAFGATDLVPGVGSFGQGWASGQHDAYLDAFAVIQQLAETLRAKVQERERALYKDDGLDRPVASGQLAGYRDALAIIEAQKR